MLLVFVPVQTDPKYMLILCLFEWEWEQECPESIFLQGGRGGGGGGCRVGGRRIICESLEIEGGAENSISHGAQDVVLL